MPQAGHTALGFSLSDAEYTRGQMCKQEERTCPMAEPLLLSHEDFQRCPLCHTPPTVVYIAWREHAVAYQAQCPKCRLTASAATADACRSRWNMLRVRTPGSRRQEGAIPYISLAVDLHSCVRDLGVFLPELQAWLVARLSPDCDDDIDVQLVQSAGLHDLRFPPADAEEEKEPAHG